MDPGPTAPPAEHDGRNPRITRIAPAGQSQQIVSPSSESPRNTATRHGAAAMQKVVVRKPGGAERLLIEEAPDPHPQPREVCVSVRAAGVNFADLVVNPNT
jgi:hypothetical protein